MVVIYLRHHNGDLIGEDLERLLGLFLHVVEEFLLLELLLGPICFRLFAFPLSSVLKGIDLTVCVQGALGVGRLLVRGRPQTCQGASKG